MKAIFTDYLNIYEAFPVDQYLTKEHRKQRYQALCQYEQNHYDDTVNMEELEVFLAKYGRKIQMTLPFMKQIAPTLKRDIEMGNVGALKFLLTTDSMTKETLARQFSLFTFEIFGDYVELLNLLIEREPNYEPALREKFRLFNRWIDFDLHELPWAVLVERPKIEEALKELEVFREIGWKLGEDSERLDHQVAESRFYYLAWKDYLDHQTQYGDFPTYLEQNGRFEEQQKREENNG